MPPRKKAANETDDEACLPTRTRSTNVSKHPGTEAQAVLRVNKPRRAPEVIQREKDEQRSKREAKAREKLEEKIRQENLERELEQYRALQEIDVEKEGAMFPRHQSRGSKPAPSKVKKPLAPPSDLPATVEGPNHGTHTPTTSVNNKGKKRDIVLANDGKEIVASAKKARTTPQMQFPTSHPAQASITPSTPSLNASGAPVMSDKDKSQGPTRKRSSQAADNEADATHMPVHSSKKVKTIKSNEPLPLRRTETLIQFNGSRFIVERPTKNSKANPQPQPASEVPADIESKGTTPRQRDFQSSGNHAIETDTPFETPRVLKKTKRRVEPASESEGISDEGGEIVKSAVEKAKGQNKGNKQQSTVGTAAPSQSSRSAPTHSAPLSRTTALNNIKAGTAVTVTAVTKVSAAPPQSKAKQSGKAKPKTADNVDPEFIIELSDEDDSHERKVALTSPEKGAEARKSVKTRIKTTRKDSLVPLPKDAELLFSTMVLPIFIGKYFADGNGWETPLLIYLPMLQDICDRIYGQEKRLKITEDTEAWKKATQTQLWDYRSRMKTKAMQVVEEDFIAIYGEEALKDAEKRIAYGKSLCTKGDHKFTFGIINPNGKRKAQFENKLIIETLSIHFTFATAKKRLPNFEVGDPEIALALATAAVERALILWRDNHLKYDRNTLKQLRTTSAQDFSGTNYKSITLGWLERIREKRKKDNTFFAKVCTEARNLYFATGKSKLPASGSASKHSDCEIEERVGVMSDDDSDEGTSNINIAARGIWNHNSMPDADENANDDGNGNGVSNAADEDDDGDDEDNGGGDEDNGDDEADLVVADWEEMYVNGDEDGAASETCIGNGGGSDSEGFESD